LKIVQFIASKGWGGAEDSFIELCNALAKQIDIEVVLFKENLIEDKLDKKIIIHRLTSSSSRYNPFLYLELKQLLQKINPDIIHTHSAKASEIIYYLSKLIPLRQVATKRNPRKAKIFNKIKYIVAISQNVAQSISNTSPTIIYNGLFKKTQNHTFKKTDDNIFTIVAIGRLDKIKGFDKLIDEVSKLELPYKLELIGDGIELDNLKQLAKQKGISKKVDFLGYREDIPSIISNSDLVVVSSLSEGFGRVVIESLFYGKLLISTKVGISTEILPKSLLVEHNQIADKIKEIYKNQPKYIQLFESVKKEYLKKFSIQEKVQEYKNYYESILQRDKIK
jgi:glycosyltransferase involved in cell wall biosynthesis